MDTKIDDYGECSGDEDNRNQLVAASYEPMKIKDSHSQPQRQGRTSKRPKGPPIKCLLCKKVWDKTGKGGRLFMFGGSRPFMAKFEAKMKALVGKEDLESMKKDSATKFGRSYICRECFMLVKQAYDSIRTLQRSVAKSVEMVSQNVNTRGCLSDSACIADDRSDSDQDLDIDYKAVNSSRRNLPPVSERVAQKIANLRYITINHRVAILQLHRINEDNYSLSQHSSPLSNTSHMGCKDDTEFDLISNTSRLSQSGSEITETSQSGAESNSREDETEIKNSNVNNYFENSQDNETLRCGLQVQQAPSQNTTVSDSRQNPDKAGPARRIPSSSGGRRIVENEVSQQDLEANHSMAQTGATGRPTDGFIPNSHTEEKMVDINKSLENILSNPLLLVKSPQPIQLAEVKNENVYICTQPGCDWIFSSKFFWENHIRHFHCSGKPYQCPHENCGRSFTGKSKLELHARSHTDERPFICDKCGHGFRGNQELKAHKLTHTHEKAYQCPKCDKNFKLLSSMKRHLQFHDGNLPYHCDYHGCNKSFKSRYDLKCHYRLHTGEKPYKCKEPGCGMAFRIPCQFTMHKRAHTGERPFECLVDGCNMAYASSNTLQAHMLTHTTERPYCCEYCGKTLKHKLMYKAHLKKHERPKSLASPDEKHHDNNATATGHSNENTNCFEQNSESEHHQRKLKTHQQSIYSEQQTPEKLKTKSGATHSFKEKVMKLLCPFDPCGKEYEEAIGLEDHLRVEHTPVPREKMCFSCGLAFPTRIELQDHSNLCSQQAKQRVYQFVCQFEGCLHSFDCHENLTDHLEWHLENPPYHCEIEGCGRKFLLRRTFSAHQNEHKKQRPIACSFEQCFESFKSLFKLLKHSKVHFGFFKCPFDGCGKTTKTLNTARIHLQMHEKPFACCLCDKRFGSSSVWLKHKKSHGVNRAFICTEADCHQAFTESFSLREHQTAHSKMTNLCPECGEIYTVTNAKHECSKDSERSVNELPPQQTPFTHQQQQLQQLQQPQFNQRNHLHHQTIPDHHHQTKQAVETQLHHLPGPISQQQLNQSHLSMIPKAFAPHSVLPAQTHGPLPSSSISVSPSPSTKQHASSHLMLHLQSPPAASSTLPPHSSVQSPTLRSVLQPEQFKRIPMHAPSQVLPYQLQQQYDTTREEGLPALALDPQPYTMEQTRPERRENMRTNFMDGSEATIENQPYYNYVIVYNNPNPPQQ